METTNNLSISKKDYIAFDALSLRELIINRLNEQQVFTDQNYIGSNLAAIIDIIAYTYNTLIYYLNKTSTESMFSEAQLYENMNRIVKLIDYSPIGFQTSTLSFTCTALSNLPPGNYTIPRYSYLAVNNVTYAFNEDITFTKVEAGDEFLSELSQQKLLHQGFYLEYPIQTATGEDNEIFILNTQNVIDHFNTDVYVKTKATETWEQYISTPNLLLETSAAKKYEIRLNGNKRYEIKFGNNINGIKLSAGDQIAIYYLNSSGKDGEIGSNAFTTRSVLVPYSTEQFSSILNDVIGDQYNFLSTNITNLKFSNPGSSTPVRDIETPDEIRTTAPKKYRSQYRLVTNGDYESFIKTNFTNLIADTKCMSNWEYISEYLKYYHDIGLTNPETNQLSLYNQILFSTTCNFNNVYILVIPRTNINEFSYLLPGQKEFIKTTLLQNKTITSEIVFVDPVYKALSLGITEPFTSFNPVNDTLNCRIEITKDTNSTRNDIVIIQDIENIFKNYFDKTNTTLSQTIDILSLTKQILDVPGVKTLHTAQISNPQVRVEGLSFFIWNPAYPEFDKNIITSNIGLRRFEYPVFYNIETLKQFITVVE
jgi:hypothetical protein